MASIEIRSTTESSISVRMVDLDTNWSQGTRYCYWDCSEDGYPDVDPDNYWKRTSLSNGVSSGGGTSFSGLEPDTKYYITCAIYKASDMSYIWEFTETARTDKPEIVVNYWSWTSSNGTASPSQTQKAYTAITSKGEITDFSYLVWNDMVDKVVEIENAEGTPWHTAPYGSSTNIYLTAANTKMSSSDKTLTAKRFNSLKFQIGSAVGTNNLQDVDPDDPVLGSYFTLLADRINVWIDTL